MEQLQELVTIYKRNYEKHEEWKLSDFRNHSKPLEDLIRDAVWGKEPQLNRDSHQYRIPKKTLEEMKEELLQPEIIKELLKCKTFDEIFTMIYVLKAPYFGSLSVYDTSLRLGAIMQLYPDVIYLHRGALDGARALLGKKVLYRHAKYFCNDKEYPYIKKEILPRELHCLEPYHIENFLCINKRKFK